MNKTYILCPPNVATGGTEALHQLCDAINNLGGDAYIQYLPCGGNKCPSKFEHYNCKFTEGFEADESDKIVIPECWTGIVYSLQTRAKVYIWWLSVDNARLSHDEAQKLFKQNVTHLAQTEYARGYITSYGAEAVMLNDCIADEYFTDIHTDRQDVVCFNPVKGWEYTSELIKRSYSKTMWKPISGLKTDRAIHEALATSKVYIDFGNHPGQDRMPREAVMSRCIVITGNRGGAKNNIDVPLDSLHKFEDFDAESILMYIEYYLEHYAEEVRKQDDYREMVRRQRYSFKDSVKKIFIEA